MSDLMVEDFIVTGPGCWSIQRPSHRTITLKVAQEGPLPTVQVLPLHSHMTFAGPMTVRTVAGTDVILERGDTLEVATIEGADILTTRR